MFVKNRDLRLCIVTQIVRSRKCIRLLPTLPILFCVVIVFGVLQSPDSGFASSQKAKGDSATRPKRRKQKLLKQSPLPLPSSQKPRLLSNIMAPILARKGGVFRLLIKGEGEMLFAYHNYGPNQNRKGGSRKDSRLVFDAARFSLELKGILSYGIDFEAEIEFEHGGTGGALELEYEEFGEFEREVEKGGEVVLEEFFIRKRFGTTSMLRIGLIRVAFGQMWKANGQKDSLGAKRPESETTMLPSSWREMGFEAQGRLGNFRLTAQVLNGLDSTGFSSQRWVGLGHQQRSELIRATDLSVVGRLDFLLPWISLGSSIYHGDTTRNRPKADLVLNCKENKQQDRVVAPCGYVSARVTIFDFHLRLKWRFIRFNAMFAMGFLGNAVAISERNSRLSNNLGVLRTAVSDKALLFWTEAGIDLAHFLPIAKRHKVIPYARIEYYDTMFQPTKEIFDNPRFERFLINAGIHYAFMNALFFKLEWSRRQLGSSDFNVEHSVQLSTGIVY